MTDIVYNKNGVPFDIDAIATDLNGKADTDLTNVNDTGRKIITNLVTPELPASNPFTYNAQTWNTAFQLPEDAYIFYGGSGINNALYIQYSLDGINFFPFEHHSTDYKATTTILLPKGMYIKGTGGANSQHISYIIAKGGNQ